MSAVQRIVDRPAGLIAVSIVLAVVVGLLTSSVLGVGVFLVVPSLVTWLARR
ncbi:MAG: hypothetical protein QOD69_1753 [Solirubrobacteraceae bacterium]|jgi:uncharacterized protein YqhQ|nr:hypothetical protein [Solirubrobacteraceae bacterium]